MNLKKANTISRAKDLSKDRKTVKRPLQEVPLQRQYFRPLPEPELNHMHCENIEEGTYEVLMKGDKNIMWLCYTCNPRVRRNLKEIEKI